MPPPPPSSPSVLVRAWRVVACRLLLGVALGVALAAGALPAQRPAATGSAPAAIAAFTRRADSLVARMTLAEKVSQLSDEAAAIPRLDVPRYGWWNEALHGVARSGLATVFPQAIGFAATWDDSLVHRMATAISDEARAKHHGYVRRGSRERYQGLTIWSPNINLFRDPRWGRGQETYGEDPFLTGRLAVQFVRGLQGDDPTYLKTVATVKHFAVHSGPEPDRHGFDATVSERDLRESYLPHFERAIREGGAYSLMCAYNRVDGEAACASDRLLTTILRGEWRFPGFVTSDCGALDDIYQHHKLAASAPEAAALALRHGTDLDCGNRVYASLGDAVARGLVSEAQVDTAVRRLMLARFRLGMFDPPAAVRWAAIPERVVDSPAHRALARQVARESIVLLKNAPAAAGAAPVLPLRKDLRTLAVIGPNADQWRMLLGNYNGIPSDPVTPLRGIRAAVSPRTRVVYARGADLADGFPLLEVVPSSALRSPEGRPGLHAEYFASRAMTGAPRATATDSTLDVAWHEAAPRDGLPPDDFGVRWTGTLRVPRSGAYRLGLVGTMRFRLTLDDSLAVRSTYPSRGDEYPDPRLAQSVPLQLEAGRSYRVRIEATESYGEADLQFVWATPTTSLEDEAVAAARGADAVVLCLGLTARLEGEEMPVQIPGFRGGDRTALDLPAPQQRLLERVTALGKPTVLVLLNGSALAVNWAQAHVPAIVEAWYPGQAGGTAIADVLFGDYNPAGRLPVTFYRGTADLPPFDDYAMRGRTYRFFAGTPLYPFGHGLSYTSFRYQGLAAPDSLAAGDTLTTRVAVTNTGRRAGDEVVQLYVRHRGSAVARPRLELRGYQRVSLRPGETRTVAFAVPAASLAYWDSAGHGWVTERDTVELAVGASSGDLRLRRTVRVVGARAGVPVRSGSSGGSTGGAAVSPESAPTSGPLTVSERRRLAADVRESFRRDLLAAWFPRAIDRAQGGFLSTFDADWRPTGPQDKMIVAQSRHTWTNARASQFFAGDTSFLPAARHGYAFLRDRMWDRERGGFFWLVTRDGTPKAEADGRLVKQAYGNAFAIYALAAYYDASRDPAALRLAQQALRWLDAHAHDPVHGGYFNYLDRDGTPLRDGYHGDAPKDQNSSIHLLEALTELYQVWPDPLVRQRATEMQALIRDRIRVDPGYLTLFHAADWRPVSWRDSTEAARQRDHYYHDHVSYGHDVETAYLMLEASHVLGIAHDTVTERAAKQMVDHALRTGWDAARGGFYDAGYYYRPDDARPAVVQRSKNWWAQAEAMNTLLLMADRFPDDPMRYADRFRMQWRYVTRYLVDQARGGWYEGGLDEEPARRDGPKGHIWKASYHESRAYMNVVRRLEGHGAPPAVP